MSAPRSFHDAIQRARDRMATRRETPSDMALKKQIGQVLADVQEAPDGRTVLAFHQVGFSSRPWRYVSVVTGVTAVEWEDGHAPVSRRDLRGDSAWQQRQDDIGDQINDRETYDEGE